MIKLQEFYKEERLRHKLEMSIGVQKNCYRNESDKPYPSSKYPVAVHFWAKENPANLKFRKEAEEWCNKNSNEACKLRELYTNSRNRLSYEIYFDRQDTFRKFLLDVVRKYDIEEEVTPFTSQLNRPTNILPEYLLQKAQFFFRDKGMKR